MAGGGAFPARNGRRLRDMNNADVNRTLDDDCYFTSNVCQALAIECVGNWHEGICVIMTVLCLIACRVILSYTTVACLYLFSR